jgi:transglutaminase-like putative cysteine protease
MRIITHLTCALGALLIACGLGAQAPHITEHGDPSVRDDTIYRLAVDSAAYPEQSTVLLLDDGVLRVEADGRSTRTWRQVTQVLRDRAVGAFQERRFTSNPDIQKLTINWIRVVRPDGTVISARPAQMQESEVPASMVNPVYANYKVIRASLSGVAPGTLVDMSWTVEYRTPYRPGDFFQGWRVTAGNTVRRSRFIVDVPDDMTLHIAEHHLTFARHETTANHRKVYEWSTADVAWVKPEMYAPPADSNDQGMSVAVSTPGSWSDVGHWYAGLARDPLRVTSELRDTVERVVAHAATRQDSITAVHRWVAQDVRYVALALGIGGYQPRTPLTVLSTRFGDCKDKATLLIASLAVIGVDAYPVLINAGGLPERDLPTIGAFNHEIAAIKGASGYEFVDPTSDLSPLGTLPYPDEGRFALVVHPDGQTEEVTTPPDAVGANVTESRLVGAIDPTGTFAGRVDVHARGTGAMAMRAMMRLHMDSVQRAAFLRNVAAAMFPNATGDSLVTFDGKDLSAEPKLSFVVRNGQATQRSGTTDILVLHDGSSRWSRAADELEAHTPRHMPIDAMRVVGPVATVDDSRITLPAGWRARLPENVTATSAFGTYTVTYVQDGRDLVITRRLSGTRGILPKEQVGELITWFRAMAKDRVPFIVIDHS